MTRSSYSSTLAEHYIQLSPRSHAHFERARHLLPAGATRSLNSWSPYPLYLQAGQGPLVWDLDGREFVDFLNNYTALILGHADPRIVAAVAEQLHRGTSFGFSTELEATLAELLVKRIPSVE